MTWGIIQKQQNFALLIHHPSIKLLQPYGEYGRVHPCLALMCVRTTEVVSIDMSETVWILRLANEQWFFFATSHVYSHQSCTTLSRLLAITAFRALYMQCLIGSLLEEYTSFISIIDVLRSIVTYDVRQP